MEAYKRVAAARAKGRPSGNDFIQNILEGFLELIQEAWTKFPEELNRLGYQLDPSRPIMERYFRQMVENHLCQLCVPIL